MVSFASRLMASSFKNRSNTSAGFREKSVLVGLHTLSCLSLAGKSCCLRQSSDFDFCLLEFLPSGCFRQAICFCFHFHWAIFFQVSQKLRTMSSLCNKHILHYRLKYSTVIVKKIFINILFLLHCNMLLTKH